MLCVIVGRCVSTLFGISLLVGVAIAQRPYGGYGCNTLDPDRGFPKLENVNSFEDFMAQTGRTYATEEERDVRETIFKTRKKLVDLSNEAFQSGKSSFQLGINPLADRTKKEYGRLLGSKITPKGEQIVGKHRNYMKKQTNRFIPEYFDWRELGGVTAAKFQGVCQSCWSFAVTGSLEGHLFRKTGFLVPLSEQDLVDCAFEYGNNGCDGGFQDYGFLYIKEHGVALEAKYPYTQMEDPKCHHNETGIGVQIRDYANIKPGDEERMKEVVATLGPIACSINASPDSFHQYKGGIYTDEECNKEEVNHSIVVVGYGNEGGQDYWLIKNSFSSNWGENGFMKLPRNRNSFCGIASECSYPIL